MPLNISGYTDPGVIVGEQNTSSAVSVSTVPDVLAIVGYGSRVKRSINEAVKRGQILDETIVFASSPPHTVTLFNRGNRKLTDTVVRQTLANTTVEIPSSALTYNPATLTSTDAGPYDLSTNNAMGLSIDGKQGVTITFVDGVADVTITGSVIAVTTPFANIATATRAEVVDGINLALSEAEDLGYGSDYSNVASDATTGIQLTSPISTSASDVQVLAPFVLSALTELGFDPDDQATTELQIDANYYVVGATYKIDYVSVSTDVDSLSEDALSVIKVGTFANVTSFIYNRDYVLNTGNLDWTGNATAATFTGNVETFDISTDKNISLSFDGKATVNINLSDEGSPPPGYVQPVDDEEATAAEIANNINAVVSAHAAYGPAYAGVASVSDDDEVVLTSPTVGSSGSITFITPDSLDATEEIFGLEPAQLPYMVTGVGNKPTVGTLYFATYTYTRPSDEYNKPKRFFDEDSMLQDLTPVSSTNQLAIYGQLAFLNGAPSLVVCQVDDSTAQGSPTPTEIQNAIDGLKNASVVTDVCVADTRLVNQTYLMTHIEQECSPVEANYRVGWFGMPIGTAIGDKDTPDTFVFRAAMTLQVSPDSPARGRMNIVAPTNVQRTIRNEDGTETTLNFDSTLLACAVAALHTSHTSPAQSLAGQFVVGFEVDTFPLFKKGERKQLASNGTLVVTGDTGKLQILDPVTTEAGGGRLPKFSYRSATSQKDNVTKAVAQAVESNLMGIVPDSLADFIFDIKTFIGNSLTGLIQTGAIGPYRDANGNTRDIDLSRDVQVQQSKSDPTKFLFNYDYFLKYPALRFHGQFSVDNPFTA